MARQAQMSFDEKFLADVDDFAESHFMTRSGLITAALTQYMNQQRMVESVRGLAVSIDRISKQGLDPETQAEFERWADACKLLSGG